MIAIQINNKQDVEKWYKDKIDSILKNDYYIINRAILETFNLKYKIEEIIQFPYSTLEEIKNAIVSNARKFLIKEDKRFSKGNLKEPWKLIYDAYETFTSTKQNIELISKIGITVCPYCNREYINNRNTAASAQIDHFFPKSKYPIFAVSLYNLIPVCYACNHIKGEKEDLVSPYDDSVDFDNLIKFSYAVKSIDFLQNTNEIDVDLRLLESASQNINNNIRRLQIDKSYEIHTDYVQEIIKKAIIYNDSKVCELILDFPNLFSSREEVLRIVFGNYLSKKDLCKRPLAKLTKDICTELDIDLNR